MKEIFANSLCGIKHAVKRHIPLYVQHGIPDNQLTIRLHQYPRLVEAKYVTFYTLASVNKEGGKVPYQPLTVLIKVSWWRGIPWFIIIAVVVVIAILAYLAYYFKTKSDDTQTKLDFEMNDIRNIARVGFPDDSIENENLQDEEIR